MRHLSLGCLVRRAPRASIALSLIMVLGACATTVQVNARFPARNPSAAELRRITVAGFEGPDGDSFAAALEASLVSAQFDGAAYFTIVGSGGHSGHLDARAAANYGRSVGAQGVFIGRVQTEAVHNEAFQGIAIACLATNAQGNCAKFGPVQVQCIRRILQLEVIPSLISVATGRVVYSTQRAATTNTEWCGTDSQSVSDVALLAGARNVVLNEIRLDVAPYNAVLQATLKESADGLPDDADKLFDAAVASAKKGDMAEACRVWAEIDKMAPNNASTIYDLGICAETNGDYPNALARYERARTLNPKADSDIAASIARVHQLVGADSELTREQKVRDNDAATLRRQAADQIKQKQARDRAAKADIEAKHAQLVATFGADFAKAIETGQVRMGMTAAAVRAARGNPTRIDKVQGDELWHYGSQSVAFTHGKVSYIGH